MNDRPPKHCDHCPLAAHGSLPCRGEPYCTLLDPSHPRYNPRYAEVVLASAGLVERPPAPEPSAAPPWMADAPPPVYAPPPETAGLPWHELIALKPLASDCLYASQHGWRGCGCRACWARGDARYPVREVSLRDCLVCTSELLHLTPQRET